MIAFYWKCYKHYLEINILYDRVLIKIILTLYHNNDTFMHKWRSNEFYLTLNLIIYCLLIISAFINYQYVFSVHTFLCYNYCYKIIVVFFIKIFIIKFIAILLLLIIIIIWLHSSSSIENMNIFKCHDEL